MPKVLLLRCCCRWARYLAHVERGIGCAQGAVCCCADAWRRRSMHSMRACGCQGWVLIGDKLLGGVVIAAPLAQLRVEVHACTMGGKLQQWSASTSGGA